MVPALLKLGVMILTKMSSAILFITNPLNRLPQRIFTITKFLIRSLLFIFQIPKDFIDIAYRGDKDPDKEFIIKKDQNTLVTFNDRGVIFEKAITSNKSITAPFFNASSDRRLKTNINAIEDSVLPLIVSTPVYTFNYKKDPTIPVIGIMAQDVLDKNINDFNLVKKNGNGYYEIKESKMIYILWKAVQEQQKQIEALQARLEGEVNGEAND